MDTLLVKYDMMICFSGFFSDFRAIEQEMHLKKRLAIQKLHKPKMKREVARFLCQINLCKLFLPLSFLLFFAKEKNIYTVWYSICLHLKVLQQTNNYSVPSTCTVEIVLQHGSTTKESNPHELAVEIEGCQVDKEHR